MIVYHHHEHEIKKSGDYINLYILGDFHFGSLSFNKEVFEKVKNIIIKDTKAKILFLGDFTELHSTTIRQAWENATSGRKDNRYEMDEIMKWYVKKNIYSKLNWITKDNCIGMLDGNHHYRYQDNSTDVSNFCKEKGIKYLGDGEANIYLNFNYCGNIINIPIKAYHSHQCGYSETYDITKLINKSKGLEGFKIICKAHTHKPLVFPLAKEYITKYNNDILEDIIWLANAGSLYKYRNLNHKSYPEDKNYNPTAQLLPYLTIRFIKGHVNRRIELDGHYRYIYA